MTTALLVIDLQQSFAARPEEWRTVEPADIVERCAALVEDARRRGELVVWVLHEEPGSRGVFDEESGHVALLPGVAALADEPVVRKRTVNAFTSTDLEQRLRDAGITDVTIAGIRTEQCCETTARVANDLGFVVTFVADATATHPHEAWGGGTITPAEIRRATASALEGRGLARVVSVAEVLHDRR